MAKKAKSEKSSKKSSHKKVDENHELFGKKVKKTVVFHMVDDDDELFKKTAVFHVVDDDDELFKKNT